MPEVPPEVVEYQNLQQQLQLVVFQRQQLALQEKELDRALKEVASSPGPFFRFVGNVLVAREKEPLQKELQLEKDEVASRQPLLEKQEKKLKERFDVVRKKVEEYVRASKALQ